MICKYSDGHRCFLLHKNKRYVGDTDLSHERTLSYHRIPLKYSVLTRLGCLGLSRAETKKAPRIVAGGKMRQYRGNPNGPAPDSRLIVMSDKARNLKESQRKPRNTPYCDESGGDHGEYLRPTGAGGLQKTGIRSAETRSGSRGGRHRFRPDPRPVSGKSSRRFPPELGGRLRPWFPCGRRWPRSRSVTPIWSGRSKNWPGPLLISSRNSPPGCRSGN